MLASVSQTNKVAFQHNAPAKKGYDKDTILPDNLATRSRRTLDDLTSAATLYPVKGLKGSRNANFHEFLTMGKFAYIAGSAMLMSIFNKQMALGVVMYGVMKMASKSLISKPVQALTGINADMPYVKFNYELPDNINDTDITSIEHHKAFESVEFPRFDMLSKDYYANIAKKNGYGENLNDPACAAKPAIRKVVTRTRTAQNIVSYLWAAVGVAIAAQKPWDKFFKSAGKVHWKGANALDTMKRLPRRSFDVAKDFVKTFGKSCVEVVKGSKAGKILVGAAALSTVFGIANAAAGAKKKHKHVNVIKPDEGQVVQCKRT